MVKMPVADNEVVTGALAQNLAFRMEVQAVSIRKLAEKTKTSYEHVRKVAKGESLPSRRLLRGIAEALELDFAKLEPLANLDKFRKKFPSISTGLNAGNPELQPIDAVWNDLSEDQREDLVLLAQRWAYRARRRKWLHQEVEAGKRPESTDPGA